MDGNLRIGCVVMAAGNAKRFGENKLTADYCGKPLIEHALDAASADGFAAVLVVTQYPEIEQLAKSRGFSCVRNEHPDWGISHTIALGTSILEDCDAILFLVSDQPRLQKTSVSKLLEVWQQNPEKICGVGHQGKRGNPNIFPKKYFAELLKLQEDCGGNAVIRRHEDEFLLVEIPEAELTDCDTPEALEKLKKA